MRYFTYTDRLVLEKLFTQGHSMRRIAELMGRNLSTIYRELKRGSYDRLDGSSYILRRSYSADIAHQDYLYKASRKGTDLKLGNNWQYVHSVSSRLFSGESPDSIVGSLRRRGCWTVSTPTLYRYIHSGLISGKVLIHKVRRSSSPSRPPSGLSIEYRPPSVLFRSDFGHWELDSVIGSSSGSDQSLLVLTERKTRFEIIWRTKNKTAQDTVQSLKCIYQKYGSVFQSVTCDNGSEFADAKGMQDALGCPVYYCHPFTSCERGSNENCNRIIRRFFPKGSDFSVLTQSDCDSVSDYINSMYRKVLGYKSANEAYSEFVKFF